MTVVVRNRAFIFNLWMILFVVMKLRSEQLKIGIAYIKMVTSLLVVRQERLLSEKQRGRGTSCMAVVAQMSFLMDMSVALFQIMPIAKVWM